MKSESCKTLACKNTGLCLDWRESYFNPEYMFHGIKLRTCGFVPGPCIFRGCNEGVEDIVFR